MKTRGVGEDFFSFSSFYAERKRVGLKMMITYDRDG